MWSLRMMSEEKEGKVYSVKGKDYKVRVLKEVVTEPHGTGIRVPTKTERVEGEDKGNK